MRHAAGNDDEPLAGPGFLEVFMPYELRLAQRRAMLWASLDTADIPSAFLGLYLVRLESGDGSWFPSSLEGGAQLGRHVRELLCAAIRDSDIPARLSDQEHLVVLRDLDPEHAYVVAQRFLAAAGGSELLRAAKVRTRMGYLVYPLSMQPNYPPERWQDLVELARRLSGLNTGLTAAAGRGLLRGEQLAATGIPETDLVPLAFQDLETLTRNGILQLQRINIIPGF